MVLGVIGIGWYWYWSVLVLILVLVLVLVLVLISTSKPYENTNTNTTQYQYQYPNTALVLLHPYSQYIKKQSVYSVGKVYKVHSNFLSKCTAACIFVIAGVRYILLLMGTPAIRNPAFHAEID